MGLYLKSPTVHLLTLGGALFSASLVYLILSRISDTKKNEVALSNYKSTRYLLEAIFMVLFALKLIDISCIREPDYFLLYFSLPLYRNTGTIMCGDYGKKRRYCPGSQHHHTLIESQTHKILFLRGFRC